MRLMAFSGLAQPSGDACVASSWLLPESPGFEMFQDLLSREELMHVRLAEALQRVPDTLSPVGIQVPQPHRDDQFQRADRLVLNLYVLQNRPSALSAAMRSCPVAAM